jgi:hypothetical protein
MLRQASFVKTAAAKAQHDSGKGESGRDGARPSKFFVSFACFVVRTDSPYTAAATISPTCVVP